jgi:uncharacterized protein (TIGR02246 family)
MKTILLSCLLLATSHAFAQLAAPDEAAIRHTLRRLTTNWQNHHFADMASYTTPDVTWVNTVGMYWRGRPQVQQAHQAIFDTIFTGVGFTPGETTLRAVAPGVAIATMYCHVGAFYPPDGVNHGTNKEDEADNLLTLVLVKRQGQWLVSAGQTTVVRASAQANNPVAKTSAEPFDPAKIVDQH